MNTRTLNVVIVRRDTLTTSFQADGFHAAAREIARMLAGPASGLNLNDPVFIGSASAPRQEYSVGELVREVTAS